MAPDFGAAKGGRGYFPHEDVAGPNRGPIELDARIRRLDGLLANLPPPTPAPGGGGGTTLFPFDAVITPAGASADVAIQPGTINNILASNYLTVFSVPAVGTRYLVANVVSADAAVTTYTLSMDGAAPAPFGVTLALPPTAFKVLLGIIVDSVWFRTIGPGSLTAESVEAFRASKLAPAPGTLPYDIWYTWSVFA